MKAFKLITVSLAVLTVLPVAADAAKPKYMRGKPMTVVQDQSGAYLRGWAQIQGDQVELIDIEGEQHTFSRKNVNVFKVAELEAEFRKAMRDVKTEEDDKTSEYVKLFPDAKNKQLYEEVLKLAEKLAARSPDNPSREAIAARAWAQERIQQMNRTLRGDGAEEGFQLSEEDIQKIRFALIPIEGRIERLRANFRNEVRERFLEEMVQQGVFSDQDRRQFLRSTPAEQLQVIKARTGDKYQGDIEIVNDPPLIMGFRSIVVPILTRTCATPACHGGEGPSAFKLVTPMRETDQIYENFIVLETYPAKAGRLLDHTNPKRSLLATYTLPPAEVGPELAHPPTATPVPAFFKSAEDPRYEALMAWLQLLPLTMPDYGIALPQWPVPPPSATTAPAGATTRN